MHYDPQLRQILPANNGNNNIVLNTEFGRWEKYIDARIRTTSDLPNRNGYRVPGDHEGFEKLCIGHVQLHQGSVTSSRVMVLVHPFYQFSGHMRGVRGREHYQAAIAYLKRLTSFLKSRPPQNVMGVVALESMPHYAAVTSRLLEEGMVDRVIFTRDNYGFAHSPQELRVFGGKTLFYGGLFNGVCVSEAIFELEHRTEELFSGEREVPKVFAVMDIMLNANNQGEGVKPTEFIDVGRKKLPKECQITLDEIVNID